MIWNYQLHIILIIEIGKSLFTKKLKYNDYTNFTLYWMSKFVSYYMFVKFYVEN